MIDTYYIKKLLSPTKYLLDSTELLSSPSLLDSLLLLFSPSLPPILFPVFVPHLSMLCLAYFFLLLLSLCVAHQGCSCGCLLTLDLFLGLPLMHEFCTPNCTARRKAASSVIKTPHSQCREHRFDPWSGN